MAIYNNGFPMNYQQAYYPQVYQPTPAPTPAPSAGTNSGLVWVQGESGAKSYLVAPNTTVLLMDSEAQCFYLKSSDASGMPLPLRVFEYTEKSTNSPSDGASAKYVTRDELNSFKDEVRKIVGKDGASDE